MCLKGCRGVLQPLERPPRLILYRKGRPDDRPYAHPYDEVRTQTLLDQSPEHADVGGTTCCPSSQDQGEAWRRTMGRGRRNHPTDSSIHAR